MAPATTRHPVHKKLAAGASPRAPACERGFPIALPGDVTMRLFTIARSATLGLGVLGLTACNNASVIGGGGGAGGVGTTGTGNDTGGSMAYTVVASSSTGGTPTRPNKIDIVVDVDNSRSMADKQSVLALALSDLVQSFVNPPCVDGNGVPAAMQPASGNDMCPAGTMRTYDPILDIHIGIVTSSLGGHGSDSCSTAEAQSCNGSPNPSNNDAGHLIDRADPCNGTNIPTYQNQGFLAWDPSQKLTPPGDADATDLTSKFRSMVLGVGQVGCGYESQLESWYRFLVDPSPYDTITIQGGAATPSGIDQVLLQQRAEFLRPDSLLAILMLSDEDDCSIKESGQNFYAVQQRNPANNKQAFHLPRARSECATNPNDPCCGSCGQMLPNCPDDPQCTTSPTLSDLEDDINLRCWDQKRRFGIDFLYPTTRYVQALSSPMISDRNGDLVQNPIFSDLNPNDANTTIRDPGLVVLAGIVGVPWQDIARDPADLSKGFKNAAELAAAQNGHTTWDVILGDPANYVAPLDPLMVESITARAGQNSVTGDPLATPQNPLGNPINGNEYTISKNDDLQYACVFPILAPRDCASGMFVSCDCQDPNNDSPLCDPNQKTTQVRAKAYPGSRELGVLKGLGSQAVVASICPSQQNDPTRADYAYRPAVSALIESVKVRLQLN
jgi:hypothetical protein